MVDEYFLPSFTVRDSNMEKSKSTFEMKQASLLVMLSIMLISSSCTVRNFLQDQFNLQQTSVTNPSKYTILHQTNCLNFDEQATASLDQNSSVEITQSAFLFLASFFLEFNSIDQPTDFSSNDNWKFKSIPFYLLYQNLKLLS